jgi:hypothetical protein
MIDLLNSSQLETLGDITETVVRHLIEAEPDRSV